ERRGGAVRVALQPVGLGLVGGDGLGRRPERRLVGRELDRLDTALDLAFARNVGVDRQNARPRLRRIVRHGSSREQVSGSGIRLWTTVRLKAAPRNLTPET